MSKAIIQLCDERNKGDCEGSVQQWAIDGYDPVPVFVLCEKHAADFGFCTICGGFIGGTEDIFLTGEKGLCFSCFHSLNEELARSLASDMGHDDEWNE